MDRANCRKDIANLRAAHGNATESGAVSMNCGLSSGRLLPVPAERPLPDAPRPISPPWRTRWRNEYRTHRAPGPRPAGGDCPDSPCRGHMLFADLSDKDFVRIAGQHVEALNHALEGLQRTGSRIHICWGNYDGPHICRHSDGADVRHAHVRPRALRALRDVQFPRHGHEWTVFVPRPQGGYPEDSVLVPGVVDTMTNFVEHPDLVAQKDRQVHGDRVGRDRGGDRGLGLRFRAPFAGFRRPVDPEIAYAKLPAPSPRGRRGRPEAARPRSFPQVGQWPLEYEVVHVFTEMQGRKGHWRSGGLPPAAAGGAMMLS